MFQNKILLMEDYYFELILQKITPAYVSQSFLKIEKN